MRLYDKTCVVCVRPSRKKKLLLVHSEGEQIERWHAQIAVDKNSHPKKKNTSEGERSPTGVSLCVCVCSSSTRFKGVRVSNENNNNKREKKNTLHIRIHFSSNAHLLLYSARESRRESGGCLFTSI